MAVGCIHQCHTVYCVCRWIHNWTQGTCGPPASTFSAVPLLQFTATICGGPSPKGGAYIMPPIYVLFSIGYNSLLRFVYNTYSGDWAGSGSFRLSCKAPGEYQVLPHSYDWCWISANGMNHFVNGTSSLGGAHQLFYFFAGKSASNCTCSP